MSTYHFSKPMASLEITMKRSAMSTAAKYSILVQEGARRLRNMVPNTILDQQLPLINKLMVQMLWASYSMKDREIVSRRILAKYTNHIYSIQVEGRKLYWTKADRQKDIKTTKATWLENWELQPL